MINEVISLDLISLASILSRHENIRYRPRLFCICAIQRRVHLLAKLQSPQVAVGYELLPRILLAYIRDDEYYHIRVLHRQL